MMLTTKRASETHAAGHPKALPTGYLAGLRYYEKDPAQADTDVTFLLLHGLGGSLDFWTGIAPTLGNAARTIAVDMPWFGRSPGLSTRFSLEAVAQRITVFCREAGVSRCVIVAHSLGSVVAYRVAAIAPDIFERVVLISGSVLRAAEMTRHPARALREPKLALFVAAQFFFGTWRISPRLAGPLASSSLVRTLVLWPFVAHPVRVEPGLLAAAIANAGGLAAIRTLVDEYVAHLRKLGIEQLKKRPRPKRRSNPR